MRSVNTEEESLYGGLSVQCSWWGSEKAEGGEEAGMSTGNETCAAWKNDVLYIPD